MADDLKTDVFSVTHFEDKGQIGMHDLPGAIPYGETALPIGPTEVAFEDQRRSDFSMMKEANMNREESEAFIATRGLIGRWNTAELMLRAWVDPVRWKGSEQFRSHLGIPLVAEQFYSIHSVINQTLFGGYRVFKVDATSGTPLECAVAQEAVLSAQLKTCGFKGVSAKTEMREITYEGLFYGFGVAHYGWTKIKKQIIKKVQRTHPKTVSVEGVLVTIQVIEDEDDIKETVEIVEFNQPKLEHVPIRRARYAPDLRRGDPRVADWFGRIIYVTGYDLDNLRNTAGWNIPTREQLVALSAPQMRAQASANPLESMGSNTGNPIFQQTTTPQKAYPENQTERNQHDPLARKYEAFDYWTGTRHCIVLEKEYPLLNETHTFGRVPFLGFCFRNAPDSAHGYGIAFWLTDFQRICQGIVNAFMDDLNLNLMGTYTSPAGTNNSAQAQWIFPGKVFKTDAQGGKMEPLTRNAISASEPLAVIAQIKEWASAISGAGPSTMGGNSGTAGAMRTPGGVAAVTGGETVKLQDLVDVISEQVFVPFLEFCVEQNKRLKPSQVRAMLSDTLGTEFKATPLDMINGTYKVDISAGTKLAAREAVNKYIGVLETFLSSPGTVEGLAVQAMKTDYNALFTALFDTYGVPYKEQIVVPMNDDDKARMAADSQQAASQGKLGIVKAQGEVKKDVDNNQSENRMIIETGKHALKTQGVEHQAGIDAASAKAEAETPQAQGLDRAAKSAFATADKVAFQ